MDVSFAEDRVRFPRYGFRGASVHPAGDVPVERVRDADWTAMPPEIRTTDGETLFVARPHREALAGFCGRHGIPHRRRHDVWGDLLDPFLDTWFDAEDERATLDRLAGSGFGEPEVADIRARVGPVMLAYNGIVWDWVNLNLFDLLTAMTGPLVPAHLRAELGDPAEFYRWAMRVADRGGERPPL
jgi:hypothetical protein